MTINRKKKQEYPLPPGSFGLPLIGETLSFIKDPNFGNKKEAKYGSIFKTNIIGKPTVFMVGAEANHFILQTHFDHFSWREGWPENFRTLLGESLFLQDGEIHQKNRRLLMPAFHGVALTKYFNTMKEIIDRTLKKWAEMGKLTLFPEMKEMTFEIASVLLLGSEMDNREEIKLLSQKFGELTKGLFAFPFNLPFTNYGKALKARDFLLQHIEKEIEKRKNNLKEDTISLLLQSQDEEGNRFSEAQIKVQALLMLFAGHETTTSMLTSFCMALAQNPEVREKAILEQKTLMDESDFTMEQIKKMTYLDQVLKEVERLYPPVAGGFRGVVKPFVYSGYYVPKGWQVLYRIERTHKDPNIYTEPKKFDPERFNSQRMEHKKTDFSLVGFGGGARFCLGYAFAQLEMKIFASLLLRNYHWQLEPNQDLSLDRIPSLHPRSGLKIALYSGR
ncbi:cytochrome P450 [Cyanobacterium aponinum AL20118]|uniref:Cytochrome P450 n=1 Tax=Cyanobacterium aponinum AL20115 TaxID=3090662 RepID=A0AAF1C5G0_9CHRO|nr:cytochrome P450 [Cyanobacterium aponinum]WPF88811.1 cytochrome P450 [Cyanobacterium aponinum AL20115]